MHVNLHKNARTTPAMRRELRESPLPIAELARRYHLSKATVRKWRRREDGADRSHRPHHLHTTLSPAQEAVVVALRQTLLLPLDDLLAVTREFLNAGVSRSGLDRCLRRHGVSDLKALLPREASGKPAYQPFKEYAPGFVHVDVKYLPQMPDEDQRRYLFAAIDRATRWVYVEILPEKSAACAQNFLTHLLQAAPFRITQILTDNGKEFTDRFCATGEREPTGKHRFDRICHEQHIEHRLIPPRHPQTNGMIERFNGRISEVLATHHFRSGEHLAETLQRYVNVYNHHLPQRALGHVCPVAALEQWRVKQPELFVSEINNLPGLDTYAEAIGWTIVTRDEAEQLCGFDPDVPPADRAKNRSLFFDDLLDAKVREFNPRYAEAEGGLARAVSPFSHRHPRQPGQAHKSGSIYRKILRQSMIKVIISLFIAT